MSQSFCFCRSEDIFSSSDFFANNNYNWGGLPDLSKEAKKKMTEKYNSPNDSLDKKERTDLYIEECYAWLNANGDVKI